MTLLLRDADSGQIDHMAAEPTHGPHHPCSSSSWLGAKGPFLAMDNLFVDGGSTYYSMYVVILHLHVSWSAGGIPPGGAPSGPPPPHPGLDAAKLIKISLKEARPYTLD